MLCPTRIVVHHSAYGSFSFFNFGSQNLLVILGVIFNAVYRATDAEWVHIFIGGSFVSSTIPLGIAFLNAEGNSVDEVSNV